VSAGASAGAGTGVGVAVGAHGPQGENGKQPGLLGRITATIGRFFGFGKGHNNGKVAAVGVGKGPETSAGKTKGGLATRGGASIGSGKHSGKSKGEHGKAISAVAASKVVGESPSLSDSKGVETSIATSTPGGPQQSSEHVEVAIGGGSTGWIGAADSTVSQSGKEAVPVSLDGAGVQQPGALPVPKLAIEKRAGLRPPKSSSTPSSDFLIRTLQGHTSSVSAVAIRPPDGRQAISASDDRTLRLWDLETGQTLRTFESPDSVWAVAVTPDGHRAVSGSYDRTLMLWDLETGQTLRTLKGHTNIVSAVAITPDGLRAVSASWDRTLRLWDLETGQTIRTLEGHTDNVSAVAVTPDGHRVVSGSWDRTLRLWDLETGQTLRTLEGHTDWVSAVAVTPDGRYAISASGDHTLRLWDLETGQTTRTLEGHTDWVSAVAVTPDGRHVVSGSGDGTLRFWDLKTGQTIRTFEGHTDNVSAVAVTPDGRCALSASWDRTLRLWALESGKIAAFSGQNGASSGAVPSGASAIVPPKTSEQQSESPR